MNLSIERWTIRNNTNFLVDRRSAFLTMSKKSLARLRSLLAERYSIEHVTLQPEIDGKPTPVPGVTPLSSER